MGFLVFGYLFIFILFYDFFFKLVYFQKIIDVLCGARSVNASSCNWSWMLYYSPWISLLHKHKRFFKKKVHPQARKEFNTKTKKYEQHCTPRITPKKKGKRTCYLLIFFGLLFNQALVRMVGFWSDGGLNKHRMRKSWRR